jgi:phenylalanyl-tRNA synthetase beta chain
MFRGLLRPHFEFRHISRPGPAAVWTIVPPRDILRGSMNISLEWLSQFLPGPLEAHDLGERLTHAGFPVEVFEKYGSDDVFDVEVTSNRGDCLSHLGVARELGALLGRPVREPPLEIPADRQSAEPVAGATSVAIEALDLCPHYTARLILGVKIGPSPAWMVRRLEAVGLRAINNVVDVTNYVMFEMGQPLHSFDFDKLIGRRIIVRRARAGESVMSIDGHQRNLTPDMLVIADAQSPVAVAGVMGGLDSEVSGATVNVLLESARFDPLSVRKTARALTMASDSSYRFERRIDPLLPERASLRAAGLIVETAGGKLLSGMVEAGETGFVAKKLALRLAKLRQVLGVEVKAAEAVDALGRLGLRPELRGEAIETTIPSWRLDLNIEVDLVEEVARVLGYDRIPLRDQISIRLTPASPEKAAIEEIRGALTGAGYFEALTVSFVSDALARDFLPPEAKGLLRADTSVRKGDGRLRPAVLPGLLEAVRHNETVSVNGAKVFEIGPAFWLDQAGKVAEHRRVGLVGSENYREVRGAVEAVLGRLDADRTVRIVAESRPGFAPGACGRIEWGGRAVGWLGKVDRAICQKLSLRENVVAAELELDPLLELARPVRQLHALPRFPAVERDVSLVVAEAVPFERVEQTIAALKLEQLEEVRYVTTYRGKPLDKGSKSLSVRLAFRSGTSTLTSQQVEESVQRAVAAAKEQLGASLRA